MPSSATSLPLNTTGTGQVSAASTAVTLTTPVPADPATLVTTDQPVFSWSAVPLAASYDIWLTDLGGGVNQIIGSSTATSFTPATPLSPGHAYRWWIRGVSSNGTTGAWSVPADFSITPLAVPVAAAPTGTQTTDQLTFSWSAVALAAKYDVWLTDLAGGVNQVIGSSTTTSLVPATDLSPGHSYRWWVRAVSANGTTGAWSGSLDFAIAALAVPVLSGPSGTQTTDRPTFTWSAVPQAVKYDVWLTDLAGGVNQIIGSSTTTTFVPATALSPGHSYHWWARAVSSNGTAGPWSVPADFTIASQGTPIASGPTGTQMTDQPTFTWSAVALAASYDVWLTDLGGGVNQIIGSSTTTSFVPAAALSPGHNYRWWVRAVSSNGTITPWSVPSDFSISPLATPVPSGPGQPVTPPPAVSAIAPASGLPGATVTISGTGFQSDSQVFIGGVLASPTGTPTATQLKVVVPTLAPGTVGVKVANSDGQQSTLPASFTVLVAPPLAVTSVTPNSGKPGALVRVTGTGFVSGSKVFIGGTQANILGAPTATSITVAVPTLAAGPVDVKVVNPDNTQATLPAGFTVLASAAPPTITSISPSTAAFGQLVTIAGTGFQSGAKVFVGGLQATLSGTATATSLTFSVPPLPAGQADVKVVNPDNQQVVLAGGLTVILTAPPPVIYGVNPNSGVAPGATIQLLGTGFQADSKVFVGTAPATLSGTPTSTLLTIVVPNIPSGIVDVTVVNPDGQTAVLPGAFFALPLPPAV